LSLEAKSRKVSTLKGAAKYLKNPGEDRLFYVIRAYIANGMSLKALFPWAAVCHLRNTSHSKNSPSKFPPRLGSLPKLLGSPEFLWSRGNMISVKGKVYTILRCL
jgi:hypothetical protein